MAQTVDLIKESCLLHLEYTKTNSSAWGGEEVERGCIYLHVRPHDCTTCCCSVALCGCNTAREEKHEQEQGEGGGGFISSLVLGASPLSASGNVYNYNGFIATLIEYLFWSRTCVVSSSPCPPLPLPSAHFPLPCLLCLLLWLCLLFAFVRVCVCVLQDSYVYLDALKKDTLTSWAWYIN